LLPAALAATDVGGEVWIMDSANYNTATVSITKSVTIRAIPGALGSVVGNGGTALSIGGTDIMVTLRNLTIRNLAGGDIGILISNAAQVAINDCEVFGFTGAGHIGIWVSPTSPAGVTVVGSVVRNNHHGIVVSGNGHATISKTHVLANTAIGIWSNGGAADSVVHVSDSVSTGNAVGFDSTGSTQGSPNALMFVTRSVASRNATSGFQTDGGITAIMVVGESMATGNGTGFNNAFAGSVFLSRGDNTVVGNTANTSGTISSQAGT
jgi:hypothetical protein